MEDAAKAELLYHESFTNHGPDLVRTNPNYLLDFLGLGDILFKEDRKERIFGMCEKYT